MSCDQSPERPEKLVYYYTCLYIIPSSLLYPLHREFEQYLLIAHYLSTRAACVGVAKLQGTAAKISVALLRHTNVLPADRAFYQAGLQCKVRVVECVASEGREFYARVVKFLCTRDKVRFYARVIK